MNPATHKAITAHTVFRGVSHQSRGDIQDEPIKERITITLASTGRKVMFPSLIGYRVTVPFVGNFADLLPLYRYFLSLPYGRNYGPHTFLVENLNSTSNVLTITGHPFATGDAVHLAWDEAPPTLGSGSLSQTTTYYVRDLTDDTIKLYPTANDATNDTNAIDFSAAGTGDLWLCVELPLVLWRRSGVKRTYRNAVVERLPDLVMSGGKTLFEGPLVFRCLPGIGMTPDGSDQAAFYTEANEAYTPPTWAGTETLTRSVSAAWGATAPWDAFRCEGGFRATFTPTLQPFDDGVWPAASMNYSEFAVTVKGKPIGQTVLQLQNAVHGNLGVLENGDDLVLTGTGFVLTLKQAILDPASTIFSATAGVSPELTWTAGGEGASDLRAPFNLATS